MSKTALIIENLQIDYCEGGALEVAGGTALLPIANQLMAQYDTVIASIDWHPANHTSFAANHPWRKIGQILEVEGLAQALLPIHCVMNTFGAAFPSGFNKEKINAIIHKGTGVALDNYSCFFDTGKKRDTQLHTFLQKAGIKDLHIMGMTLEESIINSVKDALALGYNITVIKKACRSRLKEEEVQQIWDNLAQRGAVIHTEVY